MPAPSAPSVPNSPGVPATQAERTTIPFNADAVTPSQVSFAEADGTPAYRLPTVTVARGAALRLNSGQLAFGDPPPLGAMPEVADQLAFLCRHFQHQCGTLAKYPRLFVGRYFDFVAAEVAAHREELASALARFGSLYRPEHWAFSALRPLPRAHLHAPEAPGTDTEAPGTAGAHPPGSLVRAEIAFWTAAGAVAVDLVGRTTRGEKEARWRARLEAAGIRVVEIPHDLIDAGDADAFAARLPGDFREFWRGQALPAGPFRNDAALADLPAEA